MNRKSLKLVIPCLLSLGCLTGCGNDYNGYYNGYDLKATGAFLQQELQRLCFDTHTFYPKYSQYATYATTTKDHLSCEASSSTVQVDKNGNYILEGTKNEYFYTGKIATGIGTREHVWPCANSGNLWVHNEDAGAHYVDGSNYRGGGSDLYHIKPSTTSVNTARGNSKFCDFDDDEFKDIRNSVVSVGDGGPYKLKIQGAEETSSGKYQYADKAEPADELKGDVARILVYVWVHYGYRGEYYNHQEMIGNLDLTNVMAYGGNRDRTYEKLIEWNEMDPPSETEKIRNNVVQGIQGNRNPFVDHPELMKNLF
ncbi:MAG: endonuclease [Bacilli bacterium]|nr:endonuclease [Bacilli bacterium]